MASALFIFILHAFMCALYLCGLIPVSNHELPIQGFILVSTVGAILIAGVYLLVEGVRPRGFKDYLKFPLSWGATFLLTYGIFGYLKKELPVIEAFFMQSNFMLHLAIILGAVAFIGLNALIKKWMQGSSMIDNGLSKMVRLLPTSVSSIGFAILGVLLSFGINPKKIFGIQDLQSMTQIVKLMLSQPVLELIAIFWISIAVYVSLLIYGDKLPKTLKSVMIQAFIWVLSFVFIQGLFCYYVIGVEWNTLVYHPYFMTLRTGCVHFLMLSLIYGLIRSQRESQKNSKSALEDCSMLP